MKTRRIIESGTDRDMMIHEYLNKTFDELNKTKLMQGLNDMSSL